MMCYCGTRKLTIQRVLALGALTAALSTSVAAPLAPSADLLQLEKSVAHLPVQPTYHLAPALPPEPGNVDVGNGQASALMVPRREAALLHGAATARMTPERLQSIRPEASPQTTYPAIQVRTPAQIRAAYGMSVLPSAGMTLTPAQAANLGAGQTIYIIDAMDNPNAVSDLAAFNTKFGLPACAPLVVTPSTPLPLPAASLTGCQLAVVYTDANGQRTPTAPAFSAAWAMEIALDLQWAHAFAPLARLVLIEAPAADCLYLSAAVRLANAMGPGVVSMSFGAPEDASLTTLEDSLSFVGAQMTYFAATGDNGAAVAWPSVSAKVVAVGGTSLLAADTVSRTETAWSGTGGGLSQYTPTPSYQAKTKIAGQTALTRRGVADVALNADPYTGQYIVYTAPQGAQSWFIIGGTSMSTPEWAALLATANAMRANAKLAPVVDLNTLLYTQMATTPGTYAAVFSDVTSGTDGTCPLCTAATGYDLLTGWGTPNVGALLAALSGTVEVPLPAANLPAGLVGTAYRQTWPTVDKQGIGLSYSLTGAPSGLAVTATGVLTWAAPRPGTFNVALTVRNAKGASAAETVSLTIAPIAPTLSAASLTAMAGVPFSAVIPGVDPNGGVLSYTLSAAPAGMTVSGNVLQWPTPVAGSAGFFVTAKSSAGPSTMATYALAIRAQPVLGAASFTATVGLPWAAGMTASDTNKGAVLAYTLSGAPAGMVMNGLTGALSWPKPVPGSWTLVVTVRDQFGGQASASVKLSATGGVPALTTLTASGARTKTLTQQLSANVAAGGSFTFVLQGTAPAGLTLSSTGLLTWTKPIPGTTALTVVVTSKTTGLSSTSTVRLTVT